MFALCSVCVFSTLVMSDKNKIINTILRYGGGLRKDKVLCPVCGGELIFLEEKIKEIERETDANINPAY